MPTIHGMNNLRAIRAHEYRMERWDLFDYNILKYIQERTKPNHKKTSYADIIIMADTETSKKDKYIEGSNHVVAWSIALRAFNHNIACLWGQDPREFSKCLLNIRANLSGDEIYLYFHNLPYDWCFLRKFLIKDLGEPEAQLNIKPYYALTIRFGNGYILKDSLVLAQRKLEKWAADLDIKSKKAVGLWDYNKIRNQSDILTDDELTYIEHDVLAGVECIDVTMQGLGKNISNIPLTATGIPRGEARAIGKKNKAYDSFLRQSPIEYKMQLIYQSVFHGGYTHNNRYCMGKVFPAFCMDFASSYPFCALAFKYPSEKFWKVRSKVSPEYIIKNSDEYALIFKMKVWGVELQDPRFPMPSLAYGKTQYCTDPIIDNGKILNASYVEIYMNETDFKIFCLVYKWKNIDFDEVYASYKDYLPRWYTDYVYKCFVNKTKLKGVDKIQYQIEKGKLNAVAYGMIAQQPCKPEIVENYDTGIYDIEETFDPETEYEKHLKNRNNFLPYHWCMFVTSYAQYNLFQLGMQCVDYENGGRWLYSDTDSVYATRFNGKKLKAYNKRCKKLLESRGYGAVHHGGRDYWLGVAELDGCYSEFKGLHSKCYAVRDMKTKELKITIAGVPKSGAKCLDNDLKNFNTYTMFPGKVTGKLQHKYFIVDDIYQDENGNWTGDSIDLSPCDYVIKDANIPTIEDLENEEIEVQTYEENEIERYFS